jgi:hypothetical protein
VPEHIPAVRPAGFTLTATAEGVEGFAERAEACRKFAGQFAVVVLVVLVVKDRTWALLVN